MPNQNWNPENYKNNAYFVPELGFPVIELLDPKPGERILDLGCGNGVLTKKLIDMGCEVVGVDTSPEMVKAAKELGIDARLLDGEHLHIKEEFDGVMSNAALHWMPDQYSVVRGVWRALKPGGRFAAECGGEGCIRIIREGMKIALIRRGLDYRARNPWKYPELGTYSNMLENQGFKVSYIARIDRPTPLKNGLRGWLEVFSDRHTEGFTQKDKNEFYTEVEDYCRPMLYSEQNGWIADYVRLRFLAYKPKDTE
ncbi:MAG: methyltransferase domain-containing protein [Synergistaceae bacterium]|nr:methyltransferase domain-containing protein [Synergistaceae bacterium]